jgi:hypothetical protein
MAQGTSEQVPLALIDDVVVGDTFADTCAGASVINGNLHMTFVSVTADYSKQPAPLARRVSARLIMPIAGVIELRDVLTQVINALTTQGVIKPAEGGASQDLRSSEPTAIKAGER